MNFYPLRFCEVCRQMKREDWMFSEDECLGCHGDDGRAQAGGVKTSRCNPEAVQLRYPARDSQIPLFKEG